MSALAWWWVLTGVSLGIFLGIVIAGQLRLFDKMITSWQDKMIITVLLVTGFAAVFLLVAGGIRWATVHYSYRDCEQYADNTGREVQFVTYSFGGYECYVVTPDGIYPKSQLRESE